MVSYSFYETDTRILQYASALTKRGDSVDVIALRAEGQPSFEVLNGVNVYRVQTRTVNEKSRFSYLTRILRFMVVAAIALTRKHLSEPYAVIHVHSVPDFLVFAALVPKLRGARVIVDIHDILPEFYASKYNAGTNSKLFKALLLLERASTGFADHVIVANEIWQARLISRSVAARKCTAVRNYPDPNIFFPRNNSHRNGKFVITYPGTLNRHQGLDIAIQAFARVAREMPGAEFWIYGEGPEKARLVALRDSLGLSKRVAIRGFLPLQEIAEVMAASDLAVVPKRAGSKFGNEAASTKIMEFMSLGVPVIVSRTKIDTLYHDDSRVKFVESENEAELANAMLLLWRHPELRKQLVENGFRYIEQNNWEQKKVDYLDLIDGLGSWAGVRAGYETYA